MSFYMFLGILGVLVFLFAWSVRRPSRRSRTSSRTFQAGIPEEFECGHATYFAQIRQALTKTDDDFLRRRGSARLARRVRRERLGVALRYLESVRRDFENLLKMARIVAVLSPKVAAVGEWERLGLTVQFFRKYEIVRLQLWADLAPLPRLSALANVVSGLSVRVEAAIKELGERASASSELASMLNRGGMNPV